MKRLWYEVKTIASPAQALALVMLLAALIGYAGQAQGWARQGSLVANGYSCWN